MNRRSFFSASIKVIGLSLLSNLALNRQMGTLAQAEEKRRGGESAGGNDLPLVDPAKDSTAQGVKYVHKNSDFKEAALKTVRNGVPFEKQTCSGCALYTKKEVRNGEEVGVCILFAKKVVKGSGFCTSWNKKA